jgi:hypothetical protein
MVVLRTRTQNLGLSATGRQLALINKLFYAAGASNQAAILTQGKALQSLQQTVARRQKGVAQSPCRGSTGLLPTSPETISAAGQGVSMFSVPSAVAR